MNWAAQLPAWAALLCAALILLSAVLAFVGSLGLLRLKTFYQRVHAPTLGATLGVASMLSASIIVFTVLEQRAVIHEILIAMFVTVTTPVTLLLLVRGALLREDLANKSNE
jgi:multicomponent K+:H+ antiporter subunit G